MKTLVKKIYYKVQIITNTIVSTLSIFIFSSFKNRKKINSYKTQNSQCKVLGNGPSLRNEFANNLYDFKSSLNDLFCVNFFCENDLFSVLKPINYVIADNVFWRDRKDQQTIRLQDIFFNSMNKVDWNMNLLLPNDSLNYIRKYIKNNHINFIPYNRTPVNGFKNTRHRLYRKNLGMPRPVNILNAAIFLAVNMGYKKVYLYGADHSWISDLYVDDNNNVCCYQNHFYGEKTSFKMERGSLALGLRSIADALDSYKLIKIYAESRKCKIINKTTRSFVDIFDRED